MSDTNVMLTQSFLFSLTQNNKNYNMFKHFMTNFWQNCSDGIYNETENLNSQFLYKVPVIWTMSKLTSSKVFLSKRKRQKAVEIKMWWCKSRCNNTILKSYHHVFSINSVSSRHAKRYIYGTYPRLTNS